VDLNGTLIASDSLLECALLLAKRRPISLLKLPIWLAKGKAYLKERLAADDFLDVAQLPYRKDLCEHLQNERAKGRFIYLATAADKRIARRVAQHLGLFDGVIASDGTNNMMGTRKLDAIREVAKDDFAYAGNSRRDLVIWSAAESAILVNTARSVTEAVQRTGKVQHIFPPAGNLFVEIVRVARLHQWLKNMLVFVPLLTSFRFTEVAAVYHAMLAFFAFSFCASATYAINDLFDVQSDRSHPRKRFRPIASGRLSIPVGLGLALVSFGAGLGLAASLSFEMLAVVLAYAVTTTAYSWYVKTRVLMDVIVLAGLYTIRVFGGAIAINVQVSVWLLAFSLFVFLSLALIKRCSELMLLTSRGLAETPGRDYEVNDLKVLWPIGMATAVASILIFALYLTSSDLLTRYGTPSLLWPVGLALFYWLGRMWIKTARGEMSDDPLVYALKDIGSRTLIAGIVILTLAAHFVKLS
jgi:4-hydroxybenzoate polyprenyltransferase